MVYSVVVVSKLIFVVPPPATVKSEISYTRFDVLAATVDDVPAEAVPGTSIIVTSTVVPSGNPVTGVGKVNGPVMDWSISKLVIGIGKLI